MERGKRRGFFQLPSGARLFNFLLFAMISQLFKRFSGSHYRRFLKKAMPLVDRINALEVEYQQLTEEQLRAKTDEFRQRLKEWETL